MPALITDHVLNTALGDFTAAFNAYLPLLIVWGIRILGAVTFVGFGYALIQAISNRDWFGTLMAFGWGVVRIALVYVVMANVESWGSAFPDMGQIIGTDVSGQSPSVMTPSGLYELGLNIVAMMLNNYHWGAWFTHPIETVELHVLSLMTELLWFTAACIYFAILLEVKWYVAKGPITICFATFDQTWVILEQWVITLLQVGIRLLAALLVLAIALILSATWTSDIAALGVHFNENQAQSAMIQFVESLILVYAIWVLPKKAAGIITARHAHGVGAEGTGIDEKLVVAGTAPYRYAGHAIRRVTGL
jgi:type IV secretory pathway TrbL component